MPETTKPETLLSHSQDCPECKESFPCKRMALVMLRNRADRLARLAELDAPRLIMANEAGLILKALASLAPEHVSTALIKSGVHAPAADA